MQTVTLVPYDARWRQQFQVVAAQLAAIPSFSGLPVHHIGSTAISGIQAKDVIDVQLGVDSISQLSASQPGLTKLGYVYLPLLTDHVPASVGTAASLWTKQFWTTESRDPKVNLHIRQIGHPNWRFALLFRDYLRANEEMAKSYEAAKRSLSKAVDAAQYSSVKDPIIDIIMVAAEAWATKTNWAPPPHD